MGRPAKPAPPPVTEIAKRLEEVRREKDFPSLRSFWTHLLEGWEDAVSYEAMRTYHVDRDPPVSYLARVAEVCGYRLEWLATGRGPRTMREQHELWAREEEARQRRHLAIANAEKTARAQLLGFLREVRWAAATTAVSGGVYGLLAEVERVTRAEHRDKKKTRSALRGAVAFLNTALPRDGKHFAGVRDLSPAQAEQAWLHVKALFHLLFLPFRERELAFQQRHGVGRADNTLVETQVSDLALARAREVLDRVGWEADAETILHAAEEMFPEGGPPESTAVWAAALDLIESGTRRS